MMIILGREEDTVTGRSRGWMDSSWVLLLEGTGSASSPRKKMKKRDAHRTVSAVAPCR